MPTVQSGDNKEGIQAMPLLQQAKAKQLRVVANNQDHIVAGAEGH
jgi:hypothetical protein